MTNRKMKKQLFVSLAIILAVLLLSFASGQVLILTPENVPSTANHNKDVTLVFNVTYTGTEPDTTLSWSNGSINIGSWKTLPPLTLIQPGETKTVSAVINIPEYANGLISTQIIVEKVSGTPATPASHQILIDIADEGKMSLTSSTIQAGGGSTTIELKNTGNTILNNIEISSQGDFQVALNPDLIQTLNPGQEEEIEVELTGNIGSQVTNLQTIITAIAQDGTNTSSIITTSVSFCGNIANEGDLEIEIDDVNTIKGFGDDDDYWYPFDEIEVTVVVENNGDWDIENIEIEWELRTEGGVKIDDGDADDLDLKEGDDDEATFTIKLDQDIEDFEGEDLILYVKAIGDIDDRNAGNLDGEKTCNFDSLQTEVITSDDFVILDDIRFNGVQADDQVGGNIFSCGESIEISSEVWNIGDNDQDEVKVEVYVKEWDLIEMVEVGDIDAFSDEAFNFNLQIPENAQEGRYTLFLSVLDEDEDLFESSEDDESEFSLILNIEGECVGSDNKASISITKESGGEVDEELVLKMVLTNIADEQVVYTIAIEGYDSWASGVTLDSSALSINAGESKEIRARIVPKEGSAGDNQLTIKVFEGSKVLITQPVTIKILEKESLGFIDKLKEQNAVVWIIAFINLVLLIAIVIVIVRIAKDNKKREED